MVVLAALLGILGCDRAASATKRLLNPPEIRVAPLILDPAPCPPRRPRPARGFRPASRKLICRQIDEPEGLARLLEELLQALQMPWHRRADAMLPISDRVGATEPDEFREAPPAEPHGSTGGAEDLRERRRVLSWRLLIEERAKSRLVLELGSFVTQFPIPDGRRRHAELRGNVLLQEAEVEPALLEPVANGPQFLRISRILRFSGPQGQVAKWQRVPSR